MSVILLPIAFAVFWVTFRRAGYSLRESFLSSALIWGGVLAIVTELLGVVDQLTQAAVSIAWLSAIAVAGIIYQGLSKHSSLPIMPKNFMPTLSASSRWFLITVIAITLVLGFISLASAPNNWDSQTYHLTLRSQVYRL